MIKHFCDRCGKGLYPMVALHESVKELVNKPVEELMRLDKNDYIHTLEDWELCQDCALHMAIEFKKGGMKE